MSSSDQRADLDRQIVRLLEYANHRGWAVAHTIGEAGSGLNGHRPKLMKLLSDPKVKTIVVEHRDRLMRFGFEHVEAADRWFVSLTVEMESPDPVPAEGPACGIDVGLSHFATIATRDGEVVKVEAPKPLERYLRILRRRQRQHGRTQKGSHNRKKSALVWPDYTAASATSGGTSCTSCPRTLR